LIETKVVEKWIYSLSEYTLPTKKVAVRISRRNGTRRALSAIVARAPTTIGPGTNGATGAKRARQGYRCAAAP